MAPEISVVVPVYNCERFLSQAIESALTQTYPVKDVIVVDDGSADESLRIAQSFGSRVKTYSQVRQGPSAARNLGTARAGGDWIAFLDADDFWLPDKLEKQVQTAAGFPNAGLIYSGIVELYEDGTTKVIRAPEPDHVVERLRFEDPLFVTTVIAKRPLLLANPWDSSFRSSEDWHMFYRLSRACEFACIAEPTAYYRKHPESLTSQDFKAVLKYAEAVSSSIQEDFRGIRRLTLKARVNARLLASAAIAARAQGSDEFFSYITRSLRSWPLPDVMPNRYKVFTKMLLQKLATSRSA